MMVLDPVQSTLSSPDEPNLGSVFDILGGTAYKTYSEPLPEPTEKENEGPER